MSCSMHGRVGWLIVLVSVVACGSRTGPNAGKLLLFGGLRVVGSSYEYFSDTWDGARWSKLPVSGPTGVASPFMAER